MDISPLVSLNAFMNARCALFLAVSTIVAAGCAGLTFNSSRASVIPERLRTEYLENPLGLDANSPRFSWILQATDPKKGGQSQTAYQVLVASKEQLFDTGADLWNSGWVVSSDSQLITYRGKPLRSGQACWWKVRVKDEQGRESTWSAPATWSVGLLQPSDWAAKWVGTDMSFDRKQAAPQGNNLPDPWLRKKFMLDAAPLRAMIYVASVGYHELFVNGRRVGDAVLSPCTTDHTKRARYVTYDIAPFLIRGQNVIGIWLGFSWSIFPPYRTADKPASPIVLAQAQIELSDGRTTRVVTDESWLWHPSPNTTIGVWDFMHFGGELYDGSKEIADWSEAKCNDSGWKAVKLYQPKLTISAQNVEPNRRIKELVPVGITEPKPGVWRVDMGVNFAGWVEVKLAGTPGDKVEFKWSERAEKEMTHELHSFYIIGPGGKGTFCNRFNYGVGRWIQIEGLRQKPEAGDIRGWMIRTAYEPATVFSCSNDLLNQIFNTTLWTYENLSLGGYVVDCAQRERMGYGGDAHATTMTAMDSFKTAALYTKWAQDWRDVQGKAAAWGLNKQESEAGSGKQIEAGNLPYTAPTYWGGGGPGWSGYCITLPWEMYRHFGDRQIIEQMLPTIEAWLGFVETKAKEDLLRRYGGEWDFLGDWLWPGAEGVNGDTRETLFFNNCYWVYNLRTAAKMARIAGRTDLADKWAARAANVSTAVHKEFFNEADQSYVNGFQAYLSLALFSGVVPEQVRPSVINRLADEIRVKRQGHFWAGITGGSFVVKELMELDRPDLMFAMVSKDDYPSWGDMLRRGATTIWEDWEGKLSLCHSSYLHVGAWFSEGLAGIRPNPEGQGYKDFILKPGIWPDCPLHQVRCRFDSPCGPIESNWSREGSKTIFHFVVPPNTRATAWIPFAAGKEVRVDGPLDGPAFLKTQHRIEGTYTLFQLQPGTYEITAQ
jgi:alpha-L-rhamnosidase